MTGLASAEQESLTLAIEFSRREKPANYQPQLWE